MNLYFGANYLLGELKPMFRLKFLREDIFAGLTVACVAIPLSLAIALASGVAPGVGIISAIIGGIVAALFGGTRLAVTGPAAAMAILIAECVETYGLGGLLMIGLICGLLQVLCGVLKLGRFAKLVPLPVISAFTAGIGFIIFVGQLPKALQLPTPDQNHVFFVIKHITTYISTMNPMAFVLALITLVILRTLPKYLPKLPAPLIAVAIPTILVYFAGLQNIQLIGAIPHSLSLPKLPDFSLIHNWQPILTSAVTVFALASLETLLSSSAVDSMGTGEMHNPNQELIGQGLANASVALFGGLPVTGVIARSSVNIAAGAKTRRSPIFHSLAILAVVYICPHLVEVIPVAALAGILLSAALTMMDPRELVVFWKSDKSEALVYITTFIAIVVTDLINGVQTGIMIAFLIVGLRMLTTKTSIKLWTNKTVLRISLSGSMTFWSFNKISKIQAYIAKQPQLRFVIFEFEDLQGMDSTGARHLIDASNEIADHGVTVIYHGLLAEQRKTFELASPGEKPYIETIAESQIKDILEASGVNHSANDVLKHGMEKFLGRYVEDRKQLIDTLAKEQKPHTLLITCADSRLNPNIFFSAGLGELLIVKNVGNVIPKYTPTYTYSEAATLEFAINTLAIRNIIVCAHTECCAIKESLANTSSATKVVQNWLQIIKDGFANHPPHNVRDGVKINLLNQIENLKTYPIVSELLNKHKLHISAWIYDTHSAHILEWNSRQNDFVAIAGENMQSLSI